MAIKHSIGKLSFELPFEIFIAQQLAINNFDLLNINVNHLNVVASLPLHHRDPFDHLIISQAMVEKIPVVGTDKVFDSYPIQRLWWFLRKIDLQKRSLFQTSTAILKV